MRTRFSTIRTGLIALSAMVVVLGFYMVSGCGDEGGVDHPVAPGASQLTQPSGTYPIAVEDRQYKAGGGTSLGIIHNEVLTEFYKQHDFKAAKISDPELFFEYFDKAVHSTVDTTVFNISPGTFRSDYLPVLYEMRDYGAYDYFSQEIVSSQAVGYYFYGKGWIAAAERDWLIGFIDAMEGCANSVDAQLAINAYTFTNGLPVPDSFLGNFYTITVSSLSFWGDSAKWGMDWRSVIGAIGDGLSGAAGAFVGGMAGSVAGPVGTGAGVIAGGVYLGAVGSGAVSMMYDAWDEYNQ